MSAELSFENVSTNGIRLHTAFAGPENGEPVILLHGFPEAWFGWEAQIHRLGEAGYRVAAPDQRGYNLSDKPEGVYSYRMDILVEDVIGLVDALGVKRFHLAGHDFGAMVAWNLARRCPERLKSLVIANVPHPIVMGKYLRTHISQILKSWYAIFFQIPGLPERLVRANKWKMLLAAMPESLTEQERDRYREAWENPNAITGMINWYRATLRKLGGSSVSPTIQVPTLIVWGQQDRFLSSEMAPLSLDYCSDGRLVTFEDATHWVLQDKPEEVSQLMIEHFCNHSE